MSGREPERATFAWRCPWCREVEALVDRTAKPIIDHYQQRHPRRSRRWARLTPRQRWRRIRARRRG